MAFDSGTKLSTHSLVPGPLHIVQITYPKIHATLLPQARIGVKKKVVVTQGLKSIPVGSQGTTSTSRGQTGATSLAYQQPLILQTVGVRARIVLSKGSAGAAATFQALTRRKTFDSGDKSEPNALLPTPVCSNSTGNTCTPLLCTAAGLIRGPLTDCTQPTHNKVLRAILYYSLPTS